jgi:hypothetical protein
LPLQTLLWKGPDLSDSRKFTPLIWSVILNDPKLTGLLLSKGADARFRGCCIDKTKTWVCGNALGIAKQVRDQC